MFELNIVERGFLWILEKYKVFVVGGEWSFGVWLVLEYRLKVVVEVFFLKEGFGSEMKLIYILIIFIF